MRTALAFLTPVGGARDPHRSATSWFPLVGAAIGLAVGGVWWGAGELWPPAVAAALAVAADLALTGMLHVDGLADSADGLLPPLDRERRLAVMAEPDVGAFGVAAVVAVLLLRWTSLASIEPDPVLVAALWATSRAGMAVALATRTPARPGGLSAAFQGGPWWPAALVPLLAAAALHSVAGAAAVTAAVLTTAAVLALADRRLGGYTGDVLGAAGLLAETAGLLVMAAEW